MRIGYGRVSTCDQNPYDQRDALKAAGCEEILPDKASGTLARRPALDEGRRVSRAGDQRGRTGGQKPKLTARQAKIAQDMYDEKGDDGRRRCTVAEIAAELGVTRPTIYRHLQAQAASGAPVRLAR